MRVFLDDRAVGEEAASLSEALRAGMEAAERGGRMIVEASADGQRLSDAVLADPDGHAGTIREIRLVSADPLETVAEALSAAGQLLADAKSRQGDAAAAFMSGDVSAGAEGLKTVVNAWMSVQDTVAKTARLLGVDLERLTFEGGDGEKRLASDEIGALAGFLKELLAALASQDWSASADLLDYDLAAAADSWGAMIRRLGAVVDEKRQ